MVKFLRRSWSRFSRLGRKRKNKQVWRKPKGRDNKMREKRKGYPAVVKIGYRKSDKEKEQRVIVMNIKDLGNAKGKIAILGNVGKRKKIEILEKAKEMKVKISNLNDKKFLKKNKMKAGKKVEEKKAEKKEAKESKSSEDKK